MPITKTTRRAILEQSWKVFHRQGYHDTSLQDIATAVGLGKAGVLHHFGSKRGLMEAVLIYAADWYARYLSKVITSEASVADRLLRILTKQSRLAQLDHAGCFFGNTILETGANGPFRNTLRSFPETWIDAITRLLSERFPPEEAGERAYRLFTDYQGSVILYKLYHDDRHLVRYLRRAVDSLDHPRHEI